MDERAWPVSPQDSARRQEVVPGGLARGEPSEVRPELLALSGGALVDRLGGPGRARAVYAALRGGRDPFTAPEIPDGARRRLAAVARPSPVTARTERVAEDGTLKTLLELADGHAVESVLIPNENGRGRTTLCVSTQVGCGRGCVFCLTATMKLLRNLSASEILAQVVHALKQAPSRSLPSLRNLVFMGMGEPLDNLEAVRSALEVITDSALGLGFGPAHVTVSTVGPSPRAVRACRDLPARIAWSLHAADEELRRRLVPTHRGSVLDLRDAFADLSAARDEPLFVEMTLIDGVNDRDIDAEAAIALFHGFGREVRFNLLPMNEIGRGNLRPSAAERVHAFEGRLRTAGHFTRVRRARGDTEGAACGQLAVLATRTR